MSTRILNRREIPALQPATALWKRYQPSNAPLAFRAATRGEAGRWQTRVRAELRKVIGFDDLAAAPLAPRRIESVDKGDYRREKILIRTSAYSSMPVYMLIPKQGRPPYPTVIAFHGHGYGVKDIVGLWEDGQERDEPDGYHKDFGVALCRRGFAVAAPEISCFGERQTDFSYLNSVIGQGAPSTCTHTSMLAFHLGGSAVGLRVHDGLRLVDYLATRKDLDARRLGAMGISGGGLHTFFSACVDPRIKACVVSGYFSFFRDSIFAMHHCPCNFVPGLHRFGEIHDLAGLIAPRPMLIEAADYDPIFPIASVKRAVARTRGVYRVFGAPDAVATDYFRGRHQVSGAKAYDFLWNTLQG
jgi:dienelactone hydrolase